MFSRLICLFVGSFIVVSAVSFSSEKDLYIHLRMANESLMPLNFRTAKDSYTIPVNPVPDRMGLENINISGSSAFSEGGLKELIKKIPSRKIIVLDLIREPHGIANGVAISWKPKDNNPNFFFYDEKKGNEIEEHEEKLLSRLRQSETVVLDPEKSPLTLAIQQVETEHQLVNRLGLDYIRFFVKDNHRPSDQDVDRFIHLVKNLPPDSWLHVHCAGGLGRTTTFMIMFDMIMNAENVDVMTFIQRHRALGGQNLLNLHDQPGDPEPWKCAAAIERLEFLSKFHRYCLESDHFSILWSDWASSTTI